MPPLRQSALARTTSALAAGALAVPLAFAAIAAPAQATPESAQPAATETTGLAQKTIVIGIDGAGRMDKIDAADTPTIDSLRDSGTWATSLLYSDNSRWSDDWSQKGSGTWSGAGWSTILTGVWPDKHHVVDNSFTGKQYEKYPSFIDRIEEVDPAINTFAATTWTPLTSDVAEGGTITKADSLHPTGSDADTENATVAELEDADPDVLFVAFDDVDHAGHTEGAQSQAFIDAIEEVDTRISHIVDAIDARPERDHEDWTIILTADHSHKDEGGHGGGTVNERSTFVIDSGDSVPDVGRVRTINLTDIAPTVLDRAGVDIQDDWGLDGEDIQSITPDDFDAAWPNLSTREDETGIDDSLLGFTHSFPSGWSVENSDMPSGGVAEWRGWTLTTQAFWSAADRNQGRENALRMRDVFAVADSDEWADSTNSSNADHPFDSTLTSPGYDVSQLDTLAFSFQSDYFQEANQRGEVSISFDGADRTVVKEFSQSQNGLVTVTADVPQGASTAQVHFRYTGVNNWFWAIDAVASNAPRAEQPSPATGTIYVDCTAEAAGADGSEEHPLNSLTAVNALALAPGSEISFKRGTTCEGTLAPTSGGDADANVVIDAYGQGDLPIIDGVGNHDAVLLENLDHITVKDIAVTNAKDGGSERNGVRIHLRDFGKAENIELEGLKIYDVLGDDKKGLTGSAGILVAIDGSATKTWIDGLTIADNTIDHVGREGIYFKSTWSVRDEVGNQDYTGLGEWTPSVNVAVTGNTLTDIAGDGVKVDTTDGAVVSDNVLSGFQLRSNEANAGIWTFNADNTVVEHNDVSGGGSDRDGMSFDSDGGSQGTIFQYNYSHDNAGGFLLLCPYSGAWTHGTIARYNISRNDDARLFQLCAGDIDDTEIYNNTFFNDTASPAYFLQDDNSKVRGVNWRNNIVVNRTAPMSVQVKGAGLSFENNLFIGVDGVPANADGQTNPGGLDKEPGFVDDSHTPTDISDLAGMKLRANSPAIDAGIAIDDNGGQDFFGAAVSSQSGVNMGAYAGPGETDGPVAIIRGVDAHLVSETAAQVSAEVSWWGDQAPSSAMASLEVPQGWGSEAITAMLPEDIQPGQQVTMRWKVTAPATAVGDHDLTVTLESEGEQIATGTVAVDVRELYPSIEDAFNDVAITSDGADPYTGDLALSESSLSAEELKAKKGIASGASVSGQDVTYTWPQFTPGEENAVWASGQSIALSGQGEYLGLVLFSVNGYPTPVSGTGSVTYSDGSSQPFSIAAGDYYYNKPADGNTVFTTMDYRNTPDGKNDGPFSLFESTIEVDPSKQVSYVTLPNLPEFADGKSPGLLVLAMGIDGEASGGDDGASADPSGNDDADADGSDAQGTDDADADGSDVDGADAEGTDDADAASAEADGSDDTGISEDGTNGAGTDEASSNAGSDAGNADTGDSSTSDDDASDASDASDAGDDHSGTANVQGDAGSAAADSSAGADSLDGTGTADTDQATGSDGADAGEAATDEPATDQADADSQTASSAADDSASSSSAADDSTASSTAATGSQDQTPGNGHNAQAGAQQETASGAGSQVGEDSPSAEDGGLAITGVAPASALVAVALAIGAGWILRRRAVAQQR